MFTTYYLSASGKALMVTARNVGAIRVCNGGVWYKRFSIARVAKVTCKALVCEYNEKGDLVVK